MKYKDLRDFTQRLEGIGELRRVTQPVSPVLEMTELCDRVLRAGGPALLFETPTGYRLPVLGNLFGTPRRVALGMGVDAEHADDASALTSLREVGQLLSALKEPEPPKGLKDAWQAAVDGQGRVGHGAEDGVLAALPGDRLGRRGRRPEQAADPDLLARRRRRR